jgi:glycosyltransferase involved in cell wall biosynthesis
MATSSFDLDFTVAIPTYNGAQRLSDVLERLHAQQGTEELKWEIIVVDNQSTDNTAAVVRHYQAHLPHLRYALETQQGANFARQHAVHLARSPLIGFLDDDNLPSPTWIQAALEFTHSHPQAGAVGSRLLGDFAAPPPPDFDRIAAFLALTDRGDRPQLYSPAHKILPPSAGLVVRRQAWLLAVSKQGQLGLRIRDRDVAEDLEVGIHLQRHGWEIWYNPAMQVTHKIPASRLEKEYLVSLMRGIGLSRFRTRMMTFARWQWPFVVWLYAANDLRKIGRHLLTYGRNAWTEIVPASELSLYIYSLISPAFGLWNVFK